MLNLKIPTNGESSLKDARLLVVYSLINISVKDPKSLPEAFYDTTKFGKYTLGLLEKVIGQGE